MPGNRSAPARLFTQLARAIEPVACDLPTPTRCSSSPAGAACRLTAISMHSSPATAVAPAPERSMAADDDEDACFWSASSKLFRCTGCASGCRPVARVLGKIEQQQQQQQSSLSLRGGQAWPLLIRTCDWAVQQCDASSRAVHAERPPLCFTPRGIAGSARMPMRSFAAASARLLTHHSYDRCLAPWRLPTRDRQALPHLAEYPAAEERDKHRQVLLLEVQGADRHNVGGDARQICVP